MNAGKPVLLVEDDETDAKAIRRAFKELHGPLRTRAKIT